MLKTIKTTKQMRLDELIKYIFENDVRDVSFSSHLKLEPYYEFKNKVYVHHNGSISLGLGGTNRISKEDLYTVEIEEPITEDTVIETLVEIQKNEQVNLWFDTNITTYRNADTSKFYALIDGRLELVWERDED